MKQRCYNPKHDTYDLYGGRGITVCDRWIDDFPAFLADMGRRPSWRHSIDRIDPNGIYEPGNCRWATPAQQTANRRTPKDTVFIEHDGKRWELAALARHLGVKYLTLYMRVRRGNIPRA